MRLIIGILSIFRIYAFTFEVLFAIYVGYAMVVLIRRLPPFIRSLSHH